MEILLRFGQQEDPLHPFVCLRSEIGGVYSDNVTEDDRFYNYSLEKETPTNFENATFSKPVNRLLYDDFLRQDILSQAMQIPAHLFVRYSNRSDYIYRGVYFVNSLIDGNKMFELIRESFVIDPLGVLAGDKQMLEEFKKDRRAFFQKLYSRSGESFAHDHRLREVRDLPPEFFDVLPNDFRPISGDDLEQVLRDYLEEAAIRQQIGDLGEKLVKEYEEERVKLFAPQQVNNIRKVADSAGFDFESFESRGRIIRKVQIEVKTTSDRNPLRRFFMSSNEVKTMNENPDSYWLYRVFDINALEPQFFALRESVKDRIHMQAADYACQILR